MRPGKPAEQAAAQARTLLRFLQQQVETVGLTQSSAAMLALRVLTRAGGAFGAQPLATAHPAAAQLAGALAVLATAITEPPTPRQLLAFAHSAIEAAAMVRKAPRSPGAVISERLQDPRGLAESAVYAEVARARLEGASDAVLVQRAVTRALRARKRGRPGLRHVPLEPADPMRALLDLPAHGAVYLPKNDLRVRLADASHRGAFGDVLKDVALFAQAHLRPALGEELWELCRPVGFSDKAKSRVVVEVASSVHAQEAQLRSTELVLRLQQVPGFAAVKGTKIVVVPPVALPVRGRREPTSM